MLINDTTICHICGQQFDTLDLNMDFGTLSLACDDCLGVRAAAPVKACLSNSPDASAEYALARSERAEYIAEAVADRREEDTVQFNLAVSSGRAINKLYPDLIQCEVIPESYLSVMLSTSEIDYIGEDMPTDVFAADYTSRLIQKFSKEYDQKHGA